MAVSVHPVTYAVMVQTAMTPGTLAPQRLFATPPRGTSSPSASSAPVSSEPGQLVFCRLCGADSIDQDPVDSSTTIPWGRYVSPDSPVGFECRYCFSVHNDYPQYSHMGVGVLAQKLNADADFQQVFLGIRAEVISGWQKPASKRAPPQNQTSPSAHPSGDLRMVSVDDKVYKHLFGASCQDYPIITIGSTQFSLIPSKDLGVLARRFTLYQGPSQHPLIVLCIICVSQCFCIITHTNFRKPPAGCRGCRCCWSSWQDSTQRRPSGGTTPAARPAVCHWGSHEGGRNPPTIP